MPVFAIISPLLFLHRYDLCCFGELLDGFGAYSPHVGFEREDRPSSPTSPDAPVGVSGPFRPKKDNMLSPPAAFVFGSGFISSTGALFLNIPLESCEKSVYVFPMISVFKNRLPHRGLLRREEESRTWQH